MNPDLSFKYKGPIESSKSIVNRALILQAIHPNLKLNYKSEAKDILDLKNALIDFKQMDSNSIKPITVGSGGTTFRFFTLYLSKFIGTWSLKLTSQLAARPHQDLVHLLKQLGITVNDSDFKKSLIFQMRSNFWNTNRVEVDFSKSSQFFSGLALAASDQKNKFQIKCLNREQGSGYEIITLNLLKSIGIQVEDQGETVNLQKTSEIPLDTYIHIGADWSSVISILCFCFSGSEIEITNLDLASSEPDLRGLEDLKTLGLQFEIQDKKPFSIIQCKPSRLQNINDPIDLRKNPDLFPNFAVLLSQLALKENKAISMLYPLQLIYKESDRLNAMVDVLTELGFEVRTDNQKFVIKATLNASEVKKNKEFKLDSKSDHRLIIAFELLKSFGYKISYLHHQEVQKSFSNFFEIIKSRSM